MLKIPFLKVSAIIFVILALLISLFPPFNFGNGIKQYDFLFNGIKKDISLDSNNIQQYFHDKESLEYYKKLWSGSKFEFSRSVDSFFTRSGFIYPLFLNERYPNGVRKLNDKLNYKDFGLDKRQQISEFGNNDDLRPWKQTENEDLYKNAINYIYVKKEYEKEPNIWQLVPLYHFDSAGKYDVYNVSNPVYYLLERKILLSELLVEYIIAMLISLLSGYLIQIIQSWRKRNEERADITIN
jgi:hypothetical protein